jgi:hypothetical protein
MAASMRDTVACLAVGARICQDPSVQHMKSPQCFAWSSAATLRLALAIGGVTGADAWGGSVLSIASAQATDGRICAD